MMLLRAIIAALLVAGAAQAQTVIIYSRADSAQAHRAQQLAAVYGQALIDRQLPPGALWRPTIADWICGGQRVLLLWSASAAASNEIRRELDTAIACQRQIVPVLLDSTPLPGVIGDTQAIDWR